MVPDCESVIYISFPDLRFASRICYRLFLKFLHVDGSYNHRNGASHSCSVLLFINRPVIIIGNNLRGRQWMMLLSRKLLHTPGKLSCNYRIPLGWYCCVGAEDQKYLKRIW